MTKVATLVSSKIAGSPLSGTGAERGGSKEFRMKLEVTSHGVLAALAQLPDELARMDYLDSLLVEGLEGGRTDRQGLAISGLKETEPETGEEIEKIVAYAHNLYALWYVLHESLIGLPEEGRPNPLEWYLCDQMLMLADRLTSFAWKHAKSGIGQLNELVNATRQSLPSATVSRSFGTMYANGR